MKAKRTCALLLARRSVAILFVVAAFVGCSAPTGPPVATFSIVALDPRTQELGVAVQSKFIAVGSVVPWARARVGAIATQAWANTTFGPNGLVLLAQGLEPQKVLEKLLSADKDRQRRQVGIVDAKGRSATFTGRQCIAWAGGAVEGVSERRAGDSAGGAVCGMWRIAYALPCGSRRLAVFRAARRIAERSPWEAE